MKDQGVQTDLVMPSSVLAPGWSSSLDRSNLNCNNNKLIKRAPTFASMISPAHPDDKAREALRHSSEQSLGQHDMVRDASKRSEESACSYEYYIIQEPWEVEQLSKSIMSAAKTETPILGIDCEGLAKSRRMQLI